MARTSPIGRFHFAMRQLRCNVCDVRDDYFERCCAKQDPKDTYELYDKTSPWYMYVYCILHIALVWQVSAIVVERYWVNYRIWFDLFIRNKIHYALPSLRVNRKCTQMSGIIGEVLIDNIDWYLTVCERNTAHTSVLSLHLKRWRHINLVKRDHRIKCFKRYTGVII